MRGWGGSAALAEGAKWTRLSQEVYKLEESKKEDLVLVGVETPEEAGRGAPGVRAA